MTEAELRHLYIDHRMTMRDIAEHKGCAVGTVFNRIKECGIPSRRTHDYPVTIKARETWQEIGRKSKGRRLSAETRSKISASATGRRKYPNNEFWGHEKRRNDGYIAVYMPAHPHCSSEGYVMKHKLVMEKHIGRFLEPGEVIHHRNRMRDDNRIENLQVMTFEEHARLHMTERQAERRRALSMQ